jgi:hypothetical protein
MPPGKPIIIEKEKVILVEGADAYFFFIWACQAFEVQDIQVLDFGGINDLGGYLKIFKELPGYEKASTILIGRDAENNPDGAVVSIKSALKKNGFAVPESPFTFAEGKPRVAYMLFPGFESGSEGGSLLPGTLEDLCLSTTEVDLVHECVDLYVNCLKTKDITFKDLHKTRLHAYLSGKQDFAGLKVGEAAKAGAWNWNHTNLNPFKAIIKLM